MKDAAPSSSPAADFVIRASCLAPGSPPDSVVGSAFRMHDAGERCQPFMTSESGLSIFEIAFQ